MSEYTKPCQHCCHLEQTDDHIYLHGLIADLEAEIALIKGEK